MKTKINNDKIQLKAAVSTLDNYSRSLKQKQKLLNQIIEQTQYRTKADIERWRIALNQAENVLQPRRYNLLKIYDEIWLDAHIRGLIDNTLKEAVKAKPFKIVNKNDEENKDASKFFNSSWFVDMIDHIVDARFWGHSLLDVRVFKDKVKASLVSRVHVEPIYGQLLKNFTDWEGINYREMFQGYYVEIGKERDLGLLNPCIPYVLFKKNSLIAWSEYNDIFGMPFRSAYTTSRRPEDLNRLENALETMGKAAYGVFIKGVEEFNLERADGNSSSSGNNTYDALTERVNSELSKLLLGNTLTTDSGKNGSRSHGELHKDITDDVVTALMRSVEFTVNDQLIPVLIYQGLTFLEGHTFAFPVQEDKDQIVKHLDTLLKYKDVPDEWIESKLGIPVNAKQTPEPKEQTEEPKKEKQEPTKKTTKKAPEKKIDAILNMHQNIAEMYSKHSH
jgi:phage gp29-like protein